MENIIEKKLKILLLTCMNSTGLQKNDVSDVLTDYNVFNTAEFENHIHFSS